MLETDPFGGDYYIETYSLDKETLRLENYSLRFLYPSPALALKENTEKKKYFESVDTFNFKDRLYVDTDNRSSR